jgi:hypothetical protein
MANRTMHLRGLKTNPQPALSKYLHKVKRLSLLQLQYDELGINFLCFVHALVDPLIATRGSGGKDGILCRLCTKSYTIRFTPTCWDVTSQLAMHALHLSSMLAAYFGRQRSSFLDFFSHHIQHRSQPSRFEVNKVCERWQRVLLKTR